MEDKSYSIKYKNKNVVYAKKILDYDNYYKMECRHKIHLECYKYLSKVKIRPDTLCIKCHKDTCIVM